MTDDSQQDQGRTILLTQYQQVCEDLRQLDRLLWQIPSLVTLISGTLVVVVFTFMAQYGAALPAREVVLGIALLLIVTMSFILMRHRYFGVIAVGTLTKLEEELGVKHVQRTPFPKRFDDMHSECAMYPKGLLYDTAPQSIWRHGAPGPKLLFRVMLIMALSIIVLMIYVIIQPDTVTPPSCSEKVFAWIVSGLFILATLLVVVSAKRGENTKLKEEERRKHPIQSKEHVEGNRK